MTTSRSPRPRFLRHQAARSTAALLAAVAAIVLVGCSREASDEPLINVPKPKIVVPFEQSLLRAVTFPETDTDDGPWPLEQRRTFYGVLGLTVVAWNGTERINQSFGVSDPTNQTAMSASTVLPADALLSTGVAALTTTAFLTESSRNLNGPLGPAGQTFGLPRLLTNRTLGQLLSHTSGIGPAEIPSSVTDLDRFLSRSAGPTFMAGTQFRFSQTGYAILQRYFEQTYVRPFDILAEERLFKPLGLEAMHYGVRNTDAGVFDRRGRPVARAPSVATAVNGLQTSAQDLATLLEAVQKTLRRDFENPPFSPKQLGFIVTSRLGGWGMGWQLLGPAARPTAITAFDERQSHFVIAFLDRPAGLVVMTNANADGRLAREVALGVAQRFGWEQPAPLRAASATPGIDVLPTLVGGYELNGNRFDVRWTGGVLQLLPGDAFKELGVNPLPMLGLRTDQWQLASSPVIITLRRGNPATLLVDSNFAIRVADSDAAIELHSE